MYRLNRSNTYNNMMYRIFIGLTLCNTMYSYLLFRFSVEFDNPEWIDALMIDGNSISSLNSCFCNISRTQHIIYTSLIYSHFIIDRLFVMNIVYTLRTKYGRTYSLLIFHLTLFHFYSLFTLVKMFLSHIFYVQNIFFAFL